MRFSFLILLLISNLSLAQNLNCSDFKLGRFSLQYDKHIFIHNLKSDGEIKMNYDRPADSTDYVFRNEKQQMEIIYHEPEPRGMDIVWANECTYLLYLTEDEASAEQALEIQVELKEINGNCARFKAVFELTNELEIYTTGVTCKEDI